MSEEQNPRIESSKRKISDALELHQHMRGMIGLNPFNILQRVKAGVQNFKAQQAQQAQPQQVQASSNPSGNPTSNPNPNMGALQSQNAITPRTHLLNLGIFQRPPPPQAPPQPSEEEKAEIERQRRLEELEAKKKSAAEKRFRLDHLRGLSVDRT